MANRPGGLAYEYAVPFVAPGISSSEDEPRKGDYKYRPHFWVSNQTCYNKWVTIYSMNPLCYLYCQSIVYLVYCNRISSLLSLFLKSRGNHGKHKHPLPLRRYVLCPSFQIKKGYKNTYRACKRTKRKPL